jgi:membrane-bound lytic murein transglycosylase D
VRIPAGTDLAGLAAHLGFSWEQFHALNPAYRRQVSPPDRTTTAWVPKRLAQPAQAFVENPSAGKSGAVRLARGGETWWTLSRETGIPANVLCDANKGANAPMPGKAVLIPLAACSLDTGGGYEPSGKPGKAAPAALAHAQPQSSGAALAAVPAASGQPALYIVRKGDTLDSVAAKTGVGAPELASFNKANPKEALIPGTPLLIPAKAQAQTQPVPAPAVASAKPQPVQASAVQEAQADRPQTELNPNPKYKILRRSGT